MFFKNKLSDNRLRATYSAIRTPQIPPGRRAAPLRRTPPHPIPRRGRTPANSTRTHPPHGATKRTIARKILLCGGVILYL